MYKVFMSRGRDGFVSKLVQGEGTNIMELAFTLHTCT